MRLDILRRANSCDDHHTGIEEHDIADVVAAYDNEEGWGTEGVALVHLRDGEFAVIEEWSDSTGHG